MDNRALPYDAELGMFIEPVRTPDPRRLRYLRWLAEGDQLDDGPALGPPSGACSEDGPPIVAAPAYSGRA